MVRLLHVNWDCSLPEAHLVTNYKSFFFCGFVSLASIGRIRFLRYIGLIDATCPDGISTHSGAYSTKIWDFVTYFVSVNSLAIHLLTLANV